MARFQQWTPPAADPGRIGGGDESISSDRPNVVGFPLRTPAVPSDVDDASDTRTQQSRHLYEGSDSTETNPSLVFASVEEPSKRTGHQASGGEQQGTVTATISPGGRALEIPRGDDETLTKRLMLDHGGAAPSRSDVHRNGVSKTGAANGVSARKSLREEDAQIPSRLDHGGVAPSLPDAERNGVLRTGAANGASDAQIPSGTSSRNGNNARFFGKLTLTQWTLVITILLVVGLVVGLGTGLIVVLVRGGEKAGGDAAISDPSDDMPLSPPAVDMPSTSPEIAPSPLQNLEASSSTLSPSLAPTLKSQPTVFLGSETLEIIFARGYLKCGVTPGLDGFSTLNGDTYEGFEADLVSCISR